jgi:hypothetical protein
MIELHRTGFFREMPHGIAADPSLAEARNPTASHHEDRIAEYLEAGHVYMATPGVTHDALDPATQIGPPHLVTDGRFIWPADLAYYVRTYHVRLDGELLEHMMASGWEVPDELDLAELALPRSGSATAAPRPPTDGTPADAAPRAGAAPADAAPRAGAEPPPLDLAAMLASFMQSLSASGVDTDAIKEAFEGAGHEVKRAVESIGGDLRRAVDAASAQLQTHMAASLRAMNDALGKPGDERFAQARTLMSNIEAEMEEALAPQRQAEEAQRSERLSNQIRTSIAARLREHGLEPQSPAAPVRPADEPVPAKPETPSDD